jgi:hypothetical protein
MVSGDQPTWAPPPGGAFVVLQVYAGQVNYSRLALRGVAEGEMQMTKQTALDLLEQLDTRLCWTQEEFEQGVREAEAEGEEPVPNPHAFDVRLDATDDPDYERRYRIRVTPGRYNTTWADWHALLDLGEKADCSLAIQNNGIELV